MENKKYKALDLYTLSKWKDIYVYEWFTSKKDWYFVKGVLLWDENKRKIFLNWISSYITDKNVTKKILDENIKYAVWLFSKKDNKNLTLSFWKTKEVLEKFNKKISLNLYKKYFDNSFTNIDNSINNNNLDIELNATIWKTNSIDKFNIGKVKTLQGSIDFISEINSYWIEEIDLLKNRDLVNTAIETLEKAIDEENIWKISLYSILHLNYPFASKLKEKALDFLKKQEKSQIFKNFKKNSFKTLQTQ